ncbi:MAG: RidA family protein [Microthrixaceae bacterium]|nr:RidA family protein [Microthrixaceae bacterium]MCO5318333.1 RidA family protein [Microthrixaceae bacterium]
MSNEPPYSRTREAGGLLLTAGILGTRGADLVPEPGAQIEAALDNLQALLEREGAGLDDVVRLVVYLTDIASMDLLNEAFTRRFAEPRPARTTVEVSALPLGAAVELEATAESAPAR